MPWNLDNRPGELPWEGLQNDLPQLLAVQARDNTVTLVVFEATFSALALNSLVSLVRYGKVQNYLLAAVGEQSVEKCISLRLPCYNATGLLLAQSDSLSSDASIKRYSKDWIHMVRNK